MKHKKNPVKTPSITTWPKAEVNAGLSSGWEGAAWTNIHTSHDSDSKNKIYRATWNRLTKKPTVNQEGYSSIFVGLSARTLVATLAGKNDSRFRKFLPDSIKAWQKCYKLSRYADLMIGSAGDLLTCSEVETLAPGTIPSSLINDLRNITLRTVKSELKLYSQKKRVFLGLAHGLAGYLLSLEAAQATFGKTLNTSLRVQLLEVIASEKLEGPGFALWPMTSYSDDLGIHGWCHGGPGIALALVSCFAMTGYKPYIKLANTALEGIGRIQSPQRLFCCGAIGKAQILIEGFRVTGEKKWLRQALMIANEKTHEPKLLKLKRGFHRGSLGEYYLKQRLNDPTLPLVGLGPMSVKL